MPDQSNVRDFQSIVRALGARCAWSGRHTPRTLPPRLRARLAPLLGKATAQSIAVEARRRMRGAPIAIASWERPSGRPMAADHRPNRCRAESFAPTRSADQVSTPSRVSPRELRRRAGAAPERLRCARHLFDERLGHRLRFVYTRWCTVRRIILQSHPACLVHFEYVSLYW